MASAVDAGIGPARVDDAPGERRYAAVALRLLRSRLKDVAVVGGAVSLIDFLRIWPQIPDHAPIIALLPELVVNETLLSCFIIAAITLVQATSITGWRRTAFMLLAGFTTVAMKTTLFVGLAAIGYSVFIVRNHVVSSLASYLMYMAWEYSAVTVALVLYYVTQEREGDLALRARDIEFERLVKQRAVMESRLAVLRARVEPEFLFGALDEVRGLYRRNRAAADEMVDALIAYLRAALPQMRGEASTVQREVDLACAYVAVLRVPRGDALSLQGDIEEDVRDVLLPPMVLLPLSQAAFASDDAEQRRKFMIAAARTGDGVRIVVEIEGGSRPAIWRNDGPETARRTLDAYFGASARLSFGSNGQTHRAELTLAHDAVRT